MEALGGYPTKPSNPKAKKMTVLLSMTVGVGCLFFLQTQLVKPRKPVDFYSFDVKDAKGRTVSLDKYRGKVSPHRLHLLELDGQLGKRILCKLHQRPLLSFECVFVCFVCFCFLCINIICGVIPLCSPPAVQASLVVNVASHSEQTEANYRFLQELHRELGTSHFNVLAFPCGQFGDTEPGTSRDIEAFAKSVYGVTFPFFSKIKIMGSEADPAFRFLTGLRNKPQ